MDQYYCDLFYVLVMSCYYKKKLNYRNDYSKKVKLTIYVETWLSTYIKLT